MCALLKQYGLREDDKNFSKFLRGVKKDDSNAVDVAKILLSNNASINNPAFYPDGWMPLHLAVLQEHNQLLNFFIEKGANLNSQTLDSEYTPLILACKMNNRMAINSLISHVANIHIRGIDKWTALFAACSTCDVETINLLLKNGAKINDLDCDAETPIYQLREYFSNFEKCIIVMVKEFSKLSIENFPINVKNLDFINNNNTASEYFVKCINELKLMKKTFFFQFLYLLLGIENDKRNKKTFLSDEKRRICEKVFYKLT